MFIFFLFSIDLLQSFLVPERRNEIVKKALWLLLVSALPLALTIHYFSHAHGNNDKVYLLKTELLAWLTNCRSIICYNVEDESMFTTFVFLTVMLLFSIALNRRIIEFIDSMKQQRPGIKSIVSGMQLSDVFLALLCIFMVLYFKLPDSDSSAGFISSRLNLMLFLFAILWISNMNYSKWSFLLIVGVVSFSQYKLLKAHDHVFSDLNHEVSEIMCIEPAVKANSVVLPVNYSKNRLTGHNSNYLGINKPLVIIENYECNNAYFPLSWNCKQDMFDLAHSNWSRLDEILDNTKPETLRNVDYIFVQGKKEFPDSLKARVLQQYGIAKETDNFLLLEKKKRFCSDERYTGKAHFYSPTEHKRILSSSGESLFHVFRIGNMTVLTHQCAGGEFTVE
ncbi:MAG: hypothetical protein JST26_14110 [Bacteroidetes bacterium]|nr:hypothetical protein [Bacteroidota bacterium]